jgi:beta-lactamase regulating signal transducer with metallopeptidase domain
MRIKIRINLFTIFVVVSSAIFLLGSYLLATKTSLHPQFFITACGEILKDVGEHIHFNPDGVVSSFVLLIAAVGVGLALRQLVRFLIAHRRLHQLRAIERTPDKLQWIINKHDLTEKTILVVKGGKLSAYTIGLIKPKIVVSRLLIQKLSREQLEAVILHELYHLRSNHVLWLLFSRLISSLFFFIPLIEHLARELRTEFELAADAFVVDKQKTRDHLCGSLALNLQYAGDSFPHFATSPIERRVESLVGNKLSFERIGMKPLSVSIFSLALMLGIAIVQPSQVAAEFAFETGGVCRVEEGCQTTDCSGHETKDTHNFTPLVPASFSLSSSH